MSDATYHRTFLPDGPFESACRQNCHGNPNQPRNGNSYEPQFVRKPSNELRPFLQDFRTADMTIRSKPYFRSQRRRAAYMFTGGKLVPTFIVEKIDQQFALASTLWELEFSELVRDGSGRFAPIVDQDYLVVGHVGSVTPFKFICVDDPDDWQHYGRLDLYLADDNPVFVSNTVPDGWRVFDKRVPSNIYTLACSVDGEVFAGDITGSNPGAIAVDGPMEYISGGVLVARLGKAIATGVIKSLARKRLVSNAVKELSGASKKVLDRVMLRLAKAKLARKAQNTYNPVAGITHKHHRAFIQASEETQLIIVVRHTNPKSIPLIEAGCPGKPKNLEFINTSPQSGIVMANTTDEVLKAQRLGYLVIGDKNTARRMVMKNGQEVIEDVPLPQTFWNLEKGQVIDPTLKKPIVGDYDLMGVIDPKSPGRNLGLVAKNGESLTDVTNPLVQKAADALNPKFDMKRVLHGPQDMYKGFRKGATAYMPDGTVKHFELEDGVREFYEAMKRQPRAGQYPRPDPSVHVEDELAKRRARR